MSILDYLQRSTIPTPLDEGMDERLQQTILNDLIYYNLSSNKSLYSISSYAITLTFSSKKVLKLGLNLDKDSPYDIHRAIKRHLLRYTHKCLSQADITLYVDYGKKDQRYHLHGYAHGNANQINKLMAHCRTVFGYVQLKPLFDFQNWLAYCRKTQTELQIQLHKDPRRGGRVTFALSPRKCESPPQ